MSDEEKAIQPTGEKSIQPIVFDENTPMARQFRSMWNDPALMKANFAAAQYLAKTDLVPEIYHGRPENCLIAIDISNRTGHSPLMVMQQLYVVKGKPAWSGQMCIALINSCGRYSEPLKQVYFGEEGTASWGCYSTTVNLKGERIVGPEVTMQMAFDEGWSKKDGSKWKTMPKLMLAYRSGAFFARVNCPDVLLGIQMIDEIQDVNGYDEPSKQVTKFTLPEDIK